MQRVGGGCSWLRGPGATNWSYVLTTPLAGASYVLYVRVVNTPGTSEDLFSAASHTRVPFTVP